jgi:hypothetical protein
MPNRSRDRSLAKSGPPGWGFGTGLTTLSHKNKLVTDTYTRAFNIDVDGNEAHLMTGLIADYSQTRQGAGV